MWAQLLPVTPITPYRYAAEPLPAHFSFDPPGPQGSVLAIDSTPAGNPVTDAGASLGRVLFYLRGLSRNGQVSCASCHVQERGFSDPRRLSVGFGGELTGRHSMGISDSRWNRSGRTFWDERAATLEAQALEPIQDPVEMGLTLEEMVRRLSSLGTFTALFRTAFGDETVTPERVALAIAQFQRSIMSTRSKYDQGRALVSNMATPFLNFTDEENRGKTLFMLSRAQGGGGCLGCHTGELMTHDTAPQNNGLDAASGTDLGAFAVTGLERHRGAFRAPSLRNVAARAPYMHDGRFADLTAVVNFYNNGVQAHPQLDPALLMPNGQPMRLGLNPTDRQALVRFLETLTDHDLLEDPRFSNPFLGIVTVPAPSFRGDRVAAGSLATAFSSQLPEQVRAWIRDAAGVEREASVFFSTAQQVNLLVPAESAPGWARIRIEGERGDMHRGTMEIVDVQPALFSANGDGRGAPAGFLVERLADGTVRRSPLFVASGTTYQPATLRRQAGVEMVLELYGSGWGNQAQAVQARVGGASAEVVHAGRQGEFAGLDQVNLKLPADLALSGDVAVEVRWMNQSSNALTIRIE